jgi:hypothetical protein
MSLTYSNLMTRDDFGNIGLGDVTEGHPHNPLSMATAGATSTTSPGSATKGGTAASSAPMGSSAPATGPSSSITRPMDPNSMPRI